MSIMLHSITHNRNSLISDNDLCDFSTHVKLFCGDILLSLEVFEYDWLFINRELFEDNGWGIIEWFSVMFWFAHDNEQIFIFCCSSLVGFNYE